MAEGTDDAKLRSEVLTALASDERLSSQPVEVEVSEGRIVLTGRVQSFRRKLAAQEIAGATARGARIDNRLLVAAPESPPDDDIAANARRLLEQDADLVKQAIVVAVRNGRVTLSGSVASEAERTRANDVVLEAPGARQVVNQLVVEPAARTESLVVARELAHELAADPGLKGCRLRVAVSGDVAVLEGTAATRAEVEQALALVRRTWVGELRDEVVLSDAP